VGATPEKPGETFKNGRLPIGQSLKISSGRTKMIQEYYRQMQTFGCNILAVIQQYDIIKDSAVRGAMIGNANELLKPK
jgi:hypothetical protein